MSPVLQILMLVVFLFAIHFNGFRFYRAAWNADAV